MDNNNSLSEKLQFLTATEIRLLNLVAQNKTSKEIADLLFISHRTVQNHRYNIAQKLDLKGSNKLLEFALRNKELISYSISSIHYTPSEEKDQRKNGNINQKIITISAMVVIFLTMMYMYFSWTEQNGTSNISKIKSQEIIRIAVIPFRSIGSEDLDEYIADGLTEELITQISQIQDLRVIARSSVMSYKKNQKSIQEIARELNVGAVLEGSIQKAKENLRINVQLIGTNTQENLWVKTFDRKFSNILKIQREISWQVAKALKIELLLEGLNTGDKIDTVNTKAHIAYLKGKYFVNQNTGESLYRAQDYFKDAIRIEPEFAKAWAGLADTYTWLSNYGFMPPAEAYAACRKYAQKAIELNPQLGEAHTAIASVYLLYDWDFQKAESEFKKAIEINPSDVIAHRLLALLKLAKGNPEIAIELTKTTVELDPLSAVSLAFHGRTYYFKKQYHKAIQQFNNSIEIEPDFWLVHSYLGESYLELGKCDSAISALRYANELGSNNFAALARLGYGYAKCGKKDKSNEILNRLIENSDQGKLLSFQIALVYTALGDEDKTFEWMQKAYDNRHDYMLDLKMDPKLDPLRQDARFENFIKKMNLND